MIKIFEDNNSIVHIGENEIFGFITDEVCNVCNSKFIYYDKYDALFCAQCNNLLEGKCTDPACDNCKNRPERPL